MMLRLSDPYVPQANRYLKISAIDTRVCAARNRCSIALRGVHSMYDSIGEDSNLRRLRGLDQRLYRSSRLVRGERVCGYAGRDEVQREQLRLISRLF